MNVRMLRAILENIHDDMDVFVNVNGYDTEVGCFHLNEDQGYISFEPTEYEDSEDNDREYDDDETPSDPISCALPEQPPAKVGIRDI